MKKVVLLSCLLASTMFVNAQQRLVLYEEFASENCIPCAAANQGLWTLLTTGTNPNKIVLLKYMTYFGDIYDDNMPDVLTRMEYYNVTTDLKARMDGSVSPGANGGNPADLTQAHINAASAIASPFNITVTNTVTGNNLNTTINVSAEAAYAGNGVKLHTALVEAMSFATPPGNNGETEFRYVVRKMYPSAYGLAIPDTWTVGQTETYTYSNVLPTFADRAHQLFVVVWIQNDADKKVAQTAKSADLPLPAVDVASVKIGDPALTRTLKCGITDIHPEVTIKNTGINTLTSAQIYYRAKTEDTWNMQVWTGNLAANATTEVTLPAVTGAAGYFNLQDSVAMPNGSEDINPANNLSINNLSMVKSTNGQSLPVSTDFETGADNWIPYAEPGNKPIVNYFVFGSGYNGSDHSLFYRGGSLGAGNVGYNILPFTNIPSGPKALDFYVAHPGNSDDKLEIVYTLNCGLSWNTVWSATGADLATAPASIFLWSPESDNDWAEKSVNMSAVPANAQIAFRATVGANGKNNLFIDNVNFRSGAATGIETIVSKGSVSLYPNPATNQVNVVLNMDRPAIVSFRIVNMLGQQAGQQLTRQMAAGKTVTTLATDDLAPGVYFMNIITDNGSVQKKFIKK